MNNLSNYQKRVLFKMVKDKAKLRTTEGSDYKVWLHLPTGNKINVRRDTANILFLKGYITLDEKYNGKFYQYKYSGKKVK